MTEYSPAQIADILERRSDRITRNTPVQSRTILGGVINLGALFGHSNLGQRPATLNEELAGVGFSQRQIVMFRSAWQKAALGASGTFGEWVSIPQREAGEFKLTHVSSLPNINSFRDKLLENLAELQMITPEAFIPETNTPNAN